MKLITLSVHYRYPEFLRDHWTRFAACAASLKRTTGVQLSYGLVLHDETTAQIRKLAGRPPREADLNCQVLSVGRPEPQLRGGGLHARGLATAYEQLVAAGAVDDDDLIAVVDHDCHPVHEDALTAPVALLSREADLGGVGVPAVVKHLPRGNAGRFWALSGVRRAGQAGRGCQRGERGMA